MPKGHPLTKIGAWEDDTFIGCVIFGRGASGALLKPYQLSVVQGAELVRVALREHQSSVTRIVAIAMKMLKQLSPGLRLIVSFADPGQGHHGGIYQAGNWLYAGQTAPDAYYLDKNGRKWHSRNISPTGIKLNFGRPTRCPKPSECQKVVTLPKHRYLYPLDAAMRAQLLPLAKPYPRRQPLESEGPPDQGGIEGAAMRPVGSNAVAEAVPHGA